GTAFRPGESDHHATRVAYRDHLSRLGRRVPRGDDRESIADWRDLGGSRHRRLAHRRGTTAMTVRILPSILSADFTRLGEDVARMEAGGADWLHVDVMDGQFVPNLTFGAKVIEAVRSVTRLPLDVHMMVWQPEKYFEDFAAAGASRMLIHAEATPHIHRHVHHIKHLGCAAGVVVNPGTPVEALVDIAADVDTVLIMTVNPGFGGQQFIAYTVEKISRAREMLTRIGS